MKNFAQFLNENTLIKPSEISKTANALQELSEDGHALDSVDFYYEVSSAYDKPELYDISKYSDYYKAYETAWKSMENQLETIGKAGERWSSQIRKVLNSNEIYVAYVFIHDNPDLADAFVESGLSLEEFKTKKRGTIKGKEFGF
jgi:hypothetical protein